METMIPADDPVRLLSAFVEGMDLSELHDLCFHESSVFQP